MKRLFLSILISAIFILNFTSVKVLANTEQNNKTIIIKLNQYNIVYAYPKIPYINENNRIMMPINIVKDLIGADIKYIEDTVEISFSNQKIILTLDSNNAVVNGKEIKMDSMTIIDKDTKTVYLPIKILINSFNFDAEWDSVCKQLKITDDRIMKTDINNFIVEEDLYGKLVDNSNAFRINSFDLKSIDENEMCKHYKIKVEFENTTDDIISEGKEDIRYWIFSKKNVQTNSNKGIRKRPKFDKNETLTKTEEFYLDKSIVADNDIRYIIFWPRTINLD